ncbi:MAG: LysR family transcriptional regulator substrate-binding protein, partial [Blastocatellia bacterium]
FDRTNRKASVLTDTGEVLYSYARRLLNLRDESVTAVQELYNLRRGRLRIGANESTSLHLLPGIVKEFRGRYPNIKIEIFRQISAKLVRELRDSNIDFAILSHLPEDNDLDAIPVMRDELVLVVGRDHPLAGRSSVEIGDLGSESFIAHNIRSGSRERVAEAFWQRGVSYNVSIEIATIESIKKFVAIGLGIAFVPHMCVREEVAKRELVVVNVEGFNYERTLWLVRRRSEPHNHAAQAFMSMIQEWSVSNQLTLRTDFQMAEIPVSDSAMLAGKPV